jgi:hypothetical protein
MALHEPAPPWLNRPFRMSALLGAAVILMSLALLAAFPPRAPAMPRGFFTPVIAFEFIQDRQEVHALFGIPGSPVRDEVVSRMDLGNRLDFVFMVLYGAFLFSFGMEACRASGKRRYLLACPVAVAVLAGDVFENIQLLGITRMLDAGDFEHQLSLLRLFTWIKWGGIVAVFLILLPFVARAGRLGKATSGFMLASTLSGLTAFFFRGLANELFALSVQATFLLMISLCFAYRGSEVP